ncbi:MAG: CRTAC1 family protein [Mariniblastus sp.]|nr:CRTAC1 family protein [Mariniblastus sp.]
MKNVLSTLALLTVLGLIGLGVYQYSLISSEAENKRPLNEQTEIAGMLAAQRQRDVWRLEHMAFQVEHQIGKPFAEAWANHDVDGIKKFLDGDFDSFIPVDSSWEIQTTGMTEEKVRVTGSQQGEDKDSEEFLDLIFSPVLGVQIEQSQFRVLEINELGTTDWYCRVRLSGSGVTEEGDYRTYQNEAEISLRIKDKEILGISSPIKSWVTKSELIRTCEQQLMEETTSAFGLDQLGLADNWRSGAAGTRQHQFQMAVEDFDLDGDFDISVMTLNGTRHVFAYQEGVFKDVTQQLGIPDFETNPFGSSIFSTAWIDFDNDGYPDLISGMRLYKNEGGEKFTLVKGAGLFYDAEIMGLNVIDFDNDGFMDVYAIYKRHYGLSAQSAEAKSGGISNWVSENGGGKINKLYRNNGDGTFTDTSELSNATGGPRHTQSAVWFFHDQDHYPDLYLANDIGPNTLLLNRNKGGLFKDVSESTGACNHESSMAVAAGDIDNDGKTDLYVSNMFSLTGRRVAKMLVPGDYSDSVYEQILGLCSGNRLYRQSDGKYQDVTQQAGVGEAGWSWSPLMFDLDSDGLLDLYATAGFMSFDKKGSDGISSLWKAIVTFPTNQLKKLPVVGEVDIAAGELAMETPIVLEAVDQNLGSFQRNRLFLNTNGKQFTDVSAASGADIEADGRSVISADLDGDGALDLLVASSGGGALRAFSNRTPQGDRLEVRLKGVDSNRLGIGSRITAEIGERTIVRDMFLNGGFMGSGPASVWLGLGEVETIDRLSVRWTTGQTQVFENVVVNRRVLIEEGDSEIKTLKVWE